MVEKLHKWNASKFCIPLLYSYRIVLFNACIIKYVYAERTAHSQIYVL